MFSLTVIEEDEALVSNSGDWLTSTRENTTTNNKV
jgi:hypothetical protein